MAVVWWWRWWCTRKQVYERNGGKNGQDSFNPLLYERGEGVVGGAVMVCLWISKVCVCPNKMFELPRWEWKSPFGTSSITAPYLFRPMDGNSPTPITWLFADPGGLTGLAATTLSECTYLGFCRRCPTTWFRAKMKWPTTIRRCKSFPFLALIPNGKAIMYGWVLGGYWRLAGCV